MADTTMSLTVETMQQIDGISERVADRVQSLLETKGIHVIDDAIAASYRLHVVIDSLVLMVEPQDFGHVKYRCVLTITCSPTTGTSIWLDPITQDLVRRTPETPQEQAAGQLAVAGKCSSEAVDAIIKAINSQA
ncbi:hypothetical protein WK56_23635 [Burkholderia ubonensis]|uniref:hypothetical protein n=1 Tax=Burkholderia ubonensis TaxID=101571 RepID=UPI000752EC1B|nr:hypothetical protein [Burkholderia ubonensis]KVT68579.1 hypothetical protein WK56_23635 [Burkholderia ubonensis]